MDIKWLSFHRCDRADLSGYEKNQVIFEAHDNGNNDYDLITYRNYRQFKPYNEKATLLLDNSVLEIHDDTRFVRQSSNKIADLAFIASYIPKYPNGLNTYPVATYLSDSTYYLRIPNFYDDYSNDITTVRLK